jgi:DNA-binding XRE family transcriptional regulator
MIIHSITTAKSKEKPGPNKQPDKKPRKELYKEIGSRICKFRRAKGMSQEELGQLLGLGRLTITAHEIGRNRVSLITLYRMADVLDKPIFDFLP